MILHNFLRLILGLMLDISVSLIVVSSLWRRGMLMSDDVIVLSKISISSEVEFRAFLALLISSGDMIPFLKNYSMTSINPLIDSLLLYLSCFSKVKLSTVKFYLLDLFLIDSTSNTTYFI